MRTLEVFAPTAVFCANAATSVQVDRSSDVWSFRSSVGPVPAQPAMFEAASAITTPVPSLPGALEAMNSPRVADDELIAETTAAPFVVIAEDAFVARLTVMRFVA